MLNIKKLLIKKKLSKFLLGDVQLPPMAYLINVRDKLSCTVSIIHPKWVLASYACLADT
jgi:hypothetical protein